MTRITIFGAGFLGERMARDIPGCTLSRADITDPSAIQAALRETRAEAVINAAGKTGRPNVDWCESHQKETYRANVVGALNLASGCSIAGVYLFHLGSGCVFYGPSLTPGGFREDEFANPTAFYSRTKYAADLVLSSLPNVAVGRLRMPIDHLPSSRNLITKLATYREVVDVENSVTVVSDLVSAVAQLVDRRATGVFHLVNPGTMRHRDLLTLYRELVDPNHHYRLISADELVSRGLAVKDRSNCILSSTRLAQLGITMRPISLALRQTMEQYAVSVRRLEHPP